MEERAKELLDMLEEVKNLDEWRREVVDFLLVLSDGS